MRRQMWGGVLLSYGLLLSVAGCGGTGNVNNATVTAVVKPASTAAAGVATAASGPAASTAVAAAGTAASGPAAATAGAGAATAVVGAAKPAATALASINIAVPERGTPKEQVQQLWEATKPIIRSDAAAQLSEAEVQAHRIALTTPWAAVQARLAGASTKDAQDVVKVMTDIMTLINTVYGDGTAKAKGTVSQQMVDQQVNTIDQAIRALP